MAEARGVTYFNAKTYSVWNNTLYENSTVKQTLTTSTGPCAFQEVDSVDGKVLVLVDGTDGWIIDTSSVVTKINQTYTVWAANTDYVVGNKVKNVAGTHFLEVTSTSGSAPYTSGGSEPTWDLTLGATTVDNELTWTTQGGIGNFPSPHIPSIGYLDGYLFLIQANSQTIYNSDAGRPASWADNFPNFIDAEQFADDLSALSRQSNYLIASGGYSTEYFYDAANASGSPLQRNDSIATKIGIAAPYAIYQQEKFICFIGQAANGGRAVWILEGFTPKKISHEYIDRVLDLEPSLNTIFGYGFRYKGHNFYLFNLPYSSITFVFDIEEKMWHEWSFYNAGHGVFPFNFAVDVGDGLIRLQHNTNGKIYKLNPSVYQDYANPIVGEIITNKIDFDSDKRKFYRKAVVIGDQESSGDISLRWSDDDYTTWSNYRDMPNTERPYTTQLGSGRRRAFNIKHDDNTPSRLEALELIVDMGTS
jgi:hypothetical protein